MERAGNEEIQEDVEGKGLGTPATRADIIEKLVKDGYITREKKMLFLTEQGIKLIQVLPDMIKSPRLTADWENKLSLVAKGELSESVFMGGIIAMIEDMIAENRETKEKYKKLFLAKGKILGICPNCKAEILKGKYGAYCSKKCGMQVSGYFGNPFTDEQIKSLRTDRPYTDTSLFIERVIRKKQKEINLRKNKIHRKGDLNMEKTKLGISVGMLVAIVYFSIVVFGYRALLVVGGYILFVEKTEWLKKCVIKVVVLMLLYSLISTVIGIIPQFLSFGGGEGDLFGSYYLYLTSTYQIVAVILVVLNLMRIGLFLALARKVLQEKTIAIPIVDRFINAYMDK